MPYYKMKDRKVNANCQ